MKYEELKTTDGKTIIQKIPETEQERRQLEEEAKRKKGYYAGFSEAFAEGEYDPDDEEETN